jgi:hypothetical protein
VFKLAQDQRTTQAAEATAAPSCSVPQAETAPLGAA